MTVSKQTENFIDCMKTMQELYTKENFYERYSSPRRTVVVVYERALKL